MYPPEILWLGRLWCQMRQQSPLCNQNPYPTTKLHNLLRWELRSLSALIRIVTPVGYGDVGENWDYPQPPRHVGEYCPNNYQHQSFRAFHESHFTGSY